MHYYEVAPNQIIRIDCDTFTYSSEIKIQLGQIVIVEVGKKKIIGVVISEVKKPTYPTKTIASIVDNTPLPRQLVNLALWVSTYYISPLATTLQTILPTGIQKNRRPATKNNELAQRERTNNLFNNEQATTLEVLSKYESGTFLLHGVTGSGKTEIYIEIARQSINSGKSAIILVPEIALTSQLIAEFSNHFKKLLVTHSKMTESERHQVWLEALHGQEPMIVIGPRSALFMPLPNIGAIIVDEAHEPSYKQEQAPKYSALRVATMLGRFCNAKVIFGSATPNIFDYYLAEKSDKPILNLTKVARNNSIPPEISLIDMTKRSNFTKHRFLSDRMIEQINNTLHDKKQALIFHNRRGTTNVTLCKDCGWIAECPKCFLPMTLHSDKHILQCHICGQKISVPTSCPNCHEANIIHKGIGTKLIESELKKLFPNANIARFDADNKDDEAVNARYKELYEGTIDIAIGTQVIAKGLDLPQLRMVGVVQADAGLAMPDYNSDERIFQLLAQVIGRVGRNEHKTCVVVQTYQINNKNILYSLKQDYKSFYENALLERKRANFPPFTYLLKITCAYKTEFAAIKNAKNLAGQIKQMANDAIIISGPAPAFYERQNDKYHWQIVLKSPKREYLIEAIKLIPKNNWQFELDPTGLL